MELYGEMEESQDAVEDVVHDDDEDDDDEAGAPASKAGTNAKNARKRERAKRSKAMKAEAAKLRVPLRWADLSSGLLHGHLGVPDMHIADWFAGKMVNLQIESLEFWELLITQVMQSPDEDIADFWDMVVDMRAAHTAAMEAMQAAHSAAMQGAVVLIAEQRAALRWERLVTRLAEDRIAELERRAECVVCCEAHSTNALIPCGHLCLCTACAAKFGPGRAVCPMCRSVITGSLRVWGLP